MLKRATSLQRGWNVVLWWLLAAGLMWFFDSIWAGVNAWLKDNQHLAGWAQFVGVVAAIWGSGAIARWQERRLQLNAKRSAIKKARTFAGILAGTVEDSIERETRVASEIHLRRLVLSEALLDARTIAGELLELRWMAAIAAMRSIAVQVAHSFEEAEEDSQLADNRVMLISKAARLQLGIRLAEYNEKLSVHVATVCAQHPGVRAYDD